MKLEAVIVSINYADFLKVTLPNNKQLFDKLVVVTDTKDTETAQVCEFYNVKCIRTDDFYLDHPTKPNKARGINAGLKDLSLDGWVVQLDGDIWLPPMTRQILERLPLEKEKIYGIDRLMCNSYEDFYDFLYVKTKPLHEGWIYLHMDLFPVGERITQYHGDGYIPIGYFQLWHPGVSKVTAYPVIEATYDRTDILHIKQWKRELRSFIPDLVCIHLASEQHKQGQNWEGRRTMPFLPLRKNKLLNGLRNLFRKIGYRLGKLWQKLFSSKRRYLRID